MASYQTSALDPLHRNKFTFVAFQYRLMISVLLVFASPDHVRN